MEFLPKCEVNSMIPLNTVPVIIKQEKSDQNGESDVETKYSPDQRQLVDSPKINHDLKCHFDDSAFDVKTEIIKHEQWYNQNGESDVETKYSPDQRQLVDSPKINHDLKCHFDDSAFDVKTEIIKHEQWYNQSGESDVETKYSPDQRQLVDSPKINHDLKCQFDDSAFDVKTEIIKHEQWYNQSNDFGPDRERETPCTSSQSNTTDFPTTIVENLVSMIKTETKEQVKCEQVSKEGAVIWPRVVLQRLSNQTIARFVGQQNRSLAPNSQDETNSGEINSAGGSKREQRHRSKTQVPGRRTPSDMQHLVGVDNGQKTYICDHCAYKTQRCSSMRIHLRTHTGERPYKCTICAYECSVASSLKQHMSTHTGVKPYKCTVCLFSCSRAGHLKTHMSTHTGIKPYKCTQCSYRCSRAGDLKSHMATHTGIKPHECPVCSYRCSQAGDLKRHMTTHTGIKPYKCTQCSYRCSQAGHLKTHMATHTGIKPYKCTQCSHRCSQAGSLKTHMATHTGIKPYKCTQCSFSCSRAGGLKSHMATHTGIKLHKCTLCSYRSSEASNLKRHMTTHTGIKLHKCTVCSYRGVIPRDT